MTGLAGAVEPTLGDQLHDDALRKVLSHLPPGDPWRVEAVVCIGRRAATGQVFEAYDLVLDGLTEPDHPSRWGALFNLCKHAGLIESVGYGKSSRPTTNSSAAARWRGVS